MAKKDPNSPETTSAAYDAMAPVWMKMGAVLGGTDAMRTAGRLYLPQHEAESDLAWSERCARNVLVNITELTMNSWVGRPFGDPLKFSKDMPEPIQELCLTDVDLQGNDATVFARNWFRDGLSKALAHVLVEFPRRPETDQPRTKADDDREKLRPYWVQICPEDLLYARAEIVNGEEVLTQVRIRQWRTETEGFTDHLVEQIRVIEPGSVTIFEKQRIGKSRREKWVPVDSFSYDLDFIPLVTFYADRTGFMEGKPPLENLADLNITHWQSMSDQIVTLTVARFPMLAVSGVEENERKKIVVGPNTILGTTDPKGRFYYVEHSGRAIAAGRQNLLDLEEQMAEYGAMFLRKRKGNPTATARTLDSAEATSPLQDVTLRFMDALALVLHYTARWMGLEEGGSIVLPTDFGPENVEQADFDALATARTNGDISRRNYLEELRRRGTLVDDFDFEKNDSELKAESPGPKEPSQPKAEI